MIFISFSTKYKGSGKANIKNNYSITKTVFFFFLSAGETNKLTDPQDEAQVKQTHTKKYTNIVATFSAENAVFHPLPDH